MNDRFSIRFTSPPDDSGVALGHIEVGERRESFESSLGLFTPRQYQDQWVRAIERSLRERIATCLITDVVADASGNGTEQFYSIIPAEEARGIDTESPRPEGVFLTETRWEITLEPSNLKHRRWVELADGTRLHEQAVYYFDPADPDRLFPYLSDSIAGIWSLFVSNRALQIFLEELEL